MLVVSVGLQLLPLEGLMQLPTDQFIMHKNCMLGRTGNEASNE